jgi:hypothetical protein
MTHAQFGEFWLDLSRRLENRASIRAWAADTGELAQTFDAFKYGPFVVTDSADAKVLTELPRRHIETVWDHWHEYLKGDWIQDSSPVTEHIVSLIHWIETS